MSKKYRIEILDTANIDRFKLIGKTYTIEEIVNKMESVLMMLEEYIWNY